MDKPEDSADREFLARRDRAREKLDELTGAKGGSDEDRKAWFRTVYREAGRDAAAVPWADQKPKEALVSWLAAHPGQGAQALDVACGLGDNAEAIAAAGYTTTAFDLAEEAIEWAGQRFSETQVTYQTADLFDLPADWQGRFALVHECYTLQALKSPLREQAFEALASLVKPGGVLLLISRVREEGTAADGPPWPLMPSEWRRFEQLGFTLRECEDYVIRRGERSVPHVRAAFYRNT